MDYISKNGCKFLIQYHIIFVVKYRKKLLVDIGQRVKEFLIEKSLMSDFNIQEIEVDKDHVHILISSSPKVSVSQIVRSLKQSSTSRLWKLYPSFLRKHFWKKKIFWSSGYFVCTIGNASAETVKKYIQNQG